MTPVINKNTETPLNMDKTKALIAALESKVDMLETELSYIHQILLDCGFTEGLTTLKVTVEQMLKGLPDFGF